jgi:hypothetical protein
VYDGINEPVQENIEYDGRCHLREAAVWVAYLEDDKGEVESIFKGSMPRIVEPSRAIHAFGLANRSVRGIRLHGTPRRRPDSNKKST